MQSDDFEYSLWRRAKYDGYKQKCTRSQLKWQAQVFSGSTGENKPIDDVKEWGEEFSSGSASNKEGAELRPLRLCAGHSWSDARYDDS